MLLAVLYGVGIEILPMLAHTEGFYDFLGPDHTEACPETLIKSKKELVIQNELTSHQKS